MLYLKLLTLLSRASLLSDVQSKVLSEQIRYIKHNLRPQLQAPTDEQVLKAIDNAYRSAIWNIQYVTNHSHLFSAEMLLQVNSKQSLVLEALSQIRQVVQPVTEEVQPV